MKIIETRTHNHFLKSGEGSHEVFYALVYRSMVIMNSCSILIKGLQMQHNSKFSLSFQRNEQCAAYSKTNSIWKISSSINTKELGCNHTCRSSINPNLSRRSLGTGSRSMGSTGIILLPGPLPCLGQSLHKEENKPEPHKKEKTRRWYKYNSPI